MSPDSSSSRPRIFAATFVSELSVGAHVGGVGALIVLLAMHFGVPATDFAILSSFLGIGMMGYSLLSPWLLEFTAGTVLRLSAYSLIIGSLGLAFAPWIWLVIICGLLAGSGASLIILIVPAVLQGPRQARDIALANGASSVASIAAPLLYGFADSLPGIPGRVAVLMLALPAIYVLLTIRHIDFVHTPSAYAERIRGVRHRGIGRRRDLADAFGPVQSVQAFGQPEDIHVTEMARASLPHGGAPAHVPDLSHAETPDSTGESTPAPRKLTVVAALVRVALSLVTEFSLYTWGVARLVDMGVPTSTAATLGAVFPLGMAAGRLSAGFSIRWRYIFHASIAASLVGTVLVSLGTGLPQVIMGLLIAGMGNALLYPLTVDDLVAIEGISPNKGAAMCALGGGFVIFIMPLVLPLLGAYMTLGQSLLALCPLTILLFIIPVSKKAAPAQSTAPVAS